MLSARCREPRPSEFSPRLQVRVISTSNIYLFIYLFKIKTRTGQLTLLHNDGSRRNYLRKDFDINRVFDESRMT